MYVSGKLLNASFISLKEEVPHSKTGMERTTTLFRFLAFDMLCKELNREEIDFSPGSADNRKKLIEYYDYIAKLSDSTEVCNLGEINDKARHGTARIGNDFLTAQLKQANSTKGDDYPSRPAPILRIGVGTDHWSIKKHTKWKLNLDKFFEGRKSLSPFTHLAIFLIKSKPILAPSSTFIETLKKELSTLFTTELSEFIIEKIDSESVVFDDSACYEETLSKLVVDGQAINKTLNGCGEKFKLDLNAANLSFSNSIIHRTLSSLLSKRFLVFSGLAGSGKTKIAQAFARWNTPDQEHYALVPVGADWTGNENIIGYPNGLDNATYVTKPALELVRHALEPAHAATPHFLILDEMNLSHVERYFADILSAIESGEEIPLYEGNMRKVDEVDVSRKLRLPENLFIIGTVNVDETTYMFSPKVLDRANVIEFRLEPDGLQSFLSSPKAPRLEELDGKGAAFGSGFVEAAADKGREVPAAVKESYEREMLLFFNLLREHNAEFGYRTSYEAARFIHFFSQLGGYPEGSVDWFDSAMDAVVVQKFLPKLHGSRSKLEGLLWALAWACGAEPIERGGKSFAAQIREAGQAQDDALYGPETLWETLSKSNPDNPAAAARYPLSFDKVMRMWRKLVRDQFVTFAEA